MMRVNVWFDGARKSRTVLFNTLLAVLGALELMSSSLTELLGQRTTAAVMVLGCITNIVLRTVTQQSLAEKAGEPPAG